MTRPAPDLRPLYPDDAPLSPVGFYAMTRAELAHNGALHTLLTDPAIGQACYDRLIAHAHWPYGAPTGRLAAAVYQAPASERGRIDEQVDLDDGGALVIEMKVDSLAGAAQLARYMAHVAQHHHSVHGLLLRLTTVPDPHPGPAIGRMDLDGWCAVLAAITPLIPRSARIPPAIFADYRALCDNLRRQEQIVIEHPRAVLALATGDDPSRAWWASNGLWCLTRLAGRLATALAALDPAPPATWAAFDWLGPKLATDGSGGRTAFVDCAIGLGRNFYTDPTGPVTAPTGTAPRAVGFLKVRVGLQGIAPEVHVIKQGYRSGATTPQPDEREAMNTLCARLHAVAPASGWRPAGPPREGKGSGKALEWPGVLSFDAGLDAAAVTIADRVSALTTALRGALRRAAT